MTDRPNLGTALPKAYRNLIALSRLVSEEATSAGLDPNLLHLVKVHASQLNGCAFCLDMHARQAREHGETEQRLLVLAAWRETALYTEPERAALALAEAMTNLPTLREVPDEIYASAAKAFTEAQLACLAWAITVINAFNRLGVVSRWELPA